MKGMYIKHVSKVWSHAFVDLVGFHRAAKSIISISLP